MKKAAGDIIILHMYTKNENHMRYGSWDTESHRQSFLSFWTIFGPFTLLTTHKIKILKKWKKDLEMPSFFTCVTKTHNYMMYASRDMESDRHNFLSFWAIFCPLTSLLTPKIKIWKKNVKRAKRYYPFTHVYHKWRSYDVWFLR